MENVKIGIYTVLEIFIATLPNLRSAHSYSYLIYFGQYGELHIFAILFFYC